MVSNAEDTQQNTLNKVYGPLCSKNRADLRGSKRGILMANVMGKYCSGDVFSGLV